MKKRRLLFLLPLISLALGGCEKRQNIDPDQLNPEQHEDEDPTKQDFEGLSLGDATFTYDGEAHKIEVSGNLPEGTQVSYGESGNEFTEIGVYEVHATVTCEGYNDLSLQATLNIVGADFEGLSMSDLTVTYDGEEHKIEVEGTLAEGATITYGEGGNAFTDAGEYEITAIVSKTGFNDLSLSATLTINKATMEGITFDGDSVVYDGEAHSISATVPEVYEGAEVSYGALGNEFTAVGEYDVTATVSLANYNDYVITAHLSITSPGESSEDLMISDFENLTDNDLVDDYELLYYGEQGWQTPTSANITIANNQVFEGGEQTIKMKITHQGSAFKVTKELGSDKSYKTFEGFQIDTFVDDQVVGGTCKIQVQFWFKDLPLPEEYAGYANTYGTFTLASDVQRGWAHWEIPFTDDTLSIASNALVTQKFLEAGYTVKDFSMYLDKVAVIATPNYKDGKNLNVYYDNLGLLAKCSERSEEFTIVGGKYGYSDEEHYYALDLSNDLLTGAYSVDGAVVSPLTVEKTPTGLVFKDTGYSGAGLTVNAKINHAGLECTSVSGMMEAQFSYLVGMRFEKHAQVNLNFDSYTVGSPNPDTTHWYQERWNETWQPLATNNMNIRDLHTTGNPHCNATTGYYMDYRYTYTNDELFGLANKFAIDVKNDFGGAQDIKLKIKLIKSTGAEVYVVGDASNYELIPGGQLPWIHFEKILNEPVNVSAIQLVVKSTTGSNQYLYFDNVVLKYAMPSELVEPEIESISFEGYQEEYTAGDDFNTEGICTINFSNGTTKKADPEKLTFSGYDMSVADEQTVTVTYTDETYGEFTDTFTINVIAAPEYYTISDGSYYIWNGSSDAFRMDISNSLTSATVTKLGGDTYAMTVSVNGGTVTFKDAGYAGVGLTIVCAITKNNLMTVTEVTGQMASVVSGSLLDKQVKNCADLSIDFSDGTVGSPYSNTHWTSQQYKNSSWVDVKPDMNCRNDASSNKVVNLVSGGYTTNFIYTPDLSMGPVNHIKFDMANYFSGSAGDIKVKVCVIDAGGTKYYALGDANNFVTIAKDTSKGNVLVHYDLGINLCVGSKLQITTQCTAGTSYLYVDNFNVSYNA